LKQNNIIAITGGIGSGKSLAIEVLKNNGYKVISADETYKQLLLDEEFVKGIYSTLSLDYTGEFNKKEISNIVFNDKEKLQLLNNYTHPKIMEKMFKESDGITIHEVPLLFESNLQNEYSSIIVIKRDLDKRVNSVINRDDISKEEVLDRVHNQFDYSTLNDNVIIIENNGTKKSFESKVLDVVGDLVMDKIGEEMGVNEQEVKQNEVINVQVNQDNEKKNHSLLLACIGLILNLFIGVGLIFSVVVFFTTCRKDQNKVTNKWAKYISAIGILLGVMYIAAFFLIMSSK